MNDHIQIDIRQTFSYKFNKSRDTGTGKCKNKKRSVKTTTFLAVAGKPLSFLDLALLHRITSKQHFG